MKRSEPDIVDAELEVIEGPRPPREPIIANWWAVLGVVIIVIVAVLSRLAFGLLSELLEQLWP